jgi:hypothetical protein
MNSLRLNFSKYTALVAVTIGIATVLLRASPAGASNCLKDIYGKNVQCTANDVSIASASNPRKLDGSSLSSCIAGTSFSFIADFNIVTTATSRENIGLYFQTAGGSSALTGGSCSDNIISVLHDPGKAGVVNCGTGPGQVPCLGSSLYHEFDTALTGPPPDNCGDTTSADGAKQIITVEVDNAQCAAGPDGFLRLPNCTSWQQPGGVLYCYSDPSKGWPFTPAASPGSPSKCHCDSGFEVPIAVQTPGVSVKKSADKTSLDDPGGTVTYTVAVTNDQSNFGSVTLRQVCDNVYGPSPR